jgi:hypothetical protein
MELIFEAMFWLSRLLDNVSGEAVFAGLAGTAFFMMVIGPFAATLSVAADFVTRYLLYIGATLCTGLMGTSWFGEMTGIWFVDLKPVDDLLRSMGW